MMSTYELFDEVFVANGVVPVLMTILSVNWVQCSLGNRLCTRLEVNTVQAEFSIG